VKPLLTHAEVHAPKPPKPRLGVKKINAKRHGHRFPKNVNQPLRVSVAGLPCILDGAVDRDGIRHVCHWGGVMVCHYKTRGSGGPDDDNVFPGCLWVHNEQEGRTKEFEYGWQIRLKAFCRKVTAAFYEHLGEKRSRLATDKL
jgi:hypothetical protein